MKDIQTIMDALIFNARDIACEIADAEALQESDESSYTKDMAKQIAYDHIIELIVGRGE